VNPNIDALIVRRLGMGLTRDVSGKPVTRDFQRGGIHKVSHLTQKERSLLQDQLSHEKVCIEKYHGYAQKAKDPELRRMFNEFAQEEQQHYNTISGLLGQGGGQQTGGQGATQGGTQAGGQGGAQGNMQAGSQGGTLGTQTGGQQGGTFMSSRVVFGSQVPGAQQPRGYEQRDVQDTVDRAPQYMEGRQTMRQVGWTETSEELTGGAAAGTNSDASMLNDMLMTEKYVSGTYDTTIFEASNPQVRQALQHIQKDEQKHGEGIFRYMQQRGMYNPS